MVSLVYNAQFCDPIHRHVCSRQLKAASRRRGIKHSSSIREALYTTGAPRITQQDMAGEWLGLQQVNVWSYKAFSVMGTRKLLQDCELVL